MSGLVAKKASILTNRASTAWKFLHGMINVYKPAGMETSYVIKAIKQNICRGIYRFSSFKFVYLIEFLKNFFLKIH